MTSDFDKRLAAYKKLQPPKGLFNIVAMDDYEDPGEELTLIDTVADLEEARKRAKAMAHKNKGTRIFVYGADDREEVGKQPRLVIPKAKPGV